MLKVKEFYVAPEEKSTYINVELPKEPKYLYLECENNLSNFPKYNSIYKAFILVDDKSEVHNTRQAIYGSIQASGKITYLDGQIILENIYFRSLPVRVIAMY